MAASELSILVIASLGSKPAAFRKVVASVAEISVSNFHRLKYREFLLFNSSTPPEKQDKQLLDKLWKERDSIVTLALDAVRELIERGFEFTMPEDSKQFLDSLAMRGSVIQAFIAECCVLGPDERVFNVELYAAFEAFCKRNGLECLSRPKFYELLSGIPGITMKRTRIGTENRQGHMGIALKKEAPDGGTLEQQP